MTTAATAIHPTAAPATISFDDAIQSAGYGKFQSRLMLLCGLGWAADAMDILIISFALPAIGQEWSLTNAQKGLLSTVVFIGMLIGAYVWGRSSDLIGRKVGFMSTVGIASFFGLLSAFAPSFTWLLALRMLTGFGIGGMLPVDYSIFAEYLPRENRGRYLVLLESFWALGTLAAAGLAWLIVPTLGWRWLLAIEVVPSILMIFIRSHIPESPRFLLIKGETGQARAVLEQVARTNGRTLPDLPLQSVQRAAQTRPGDLWKPELRRTTLLLWVIWFAISLGYYGVFTWLPTYFRSSGMAMMPVYQNTFILAVAQLPGYFSAAWLVERWGRRRTLGAYLVVSGVFTYLFAAATSMNMLVAAGIWMSFFTLGAWGALYAYTPEAYPTNLRGTGMGSASAMTRISGAIAPSLGAVLMTSSLALPLTVFALSFIIAGAAAFGLPHETGQQPLADTLQ